ncbi:MAG: sugar ABC transporter permease [Ruminiclostridium sp.]|nr:sugar ABC transporter permease [Ruminiclostridium sp.]
MFKIKHGDDYHNNKSLVNSLYKQRFLFLMLLPAVLLTLIFHYIPLFGWIIAFKRYQVGQSIWKVPWTGLYQFKRFFMYGDDIGNLLRNTLIMNILSLILGLAIACAFAILLSEMHNRKFGKIVQTASFFPFFISWVIVYMMLNALFAVTSGAVNTTLIDMGLMQKGVNFLGDERFSWGLAVGVSIWKYLGYNSVIFIASLAGIPTEQFEAAKIDGAGRCSKIFYITLPNLMPTIIVLLILNTGWILNSGYDLFYLLTNTLNKQTMEVLDMYIYRYGLQLSDYSFATAVGILKTIVSLILVTLTNKLSHVYTGKSIL